MLPFLHGSQKLRSRQTLSSGVNIMVQVWLLLLDTAAVSSDKLSHGVAVYFEVWPFTTRHCCREVVFWQILSCGVNILLKSDLTVRDICREVEFWWNLSHTVDVMTWRTAPDCCREVGFNQTLNCNVECCIETLSCGTLADCTWHWGRSLWIMDPHSRAPKKNTGHGNEVLPQDTTHFIQRSCYQWWSLCQDPAGN